MFKPLARVNLFSLSFSYIRYFITKLTNIKRKVASNEAVAEYLNKEGPLKRSGEFGTACRICLTPPWSSMSSSKEGSDQNAVEIWISKSMLIGLSRK